MNSISFIDLGLFNFQFVLILALVFVSFENFFHVIEVVELIGMKLFIIVSFILLIFVESVVMHLL